MAEVGEAQDKKSGYVLILEDEQENIDLLSRALRSDASIWVARSIEQARGILAQNPVNVVVSDHRLPDGRGTEFLSQVARERPSVGRVLVTAYGDSAEVVDACNAGVVERFFLKPYSPQRLKSAVLELLRRGGMVKQPRVLVAEDDPDIRMFVREFLKSRSVETIEAGDGEEAIRLLSKHVFDVALLDVNLPRVDGIGVLKHASTHDPDLPVIMMTAVDTSVAMGLLEAGAHDLVTKPVRKEELLLRVERAISTRQQLAENRRLLQEIQAAQQKEAIVAESESMKAVLEQVRLLAQHDVSILVTGETGTGKEVIARMLHKQSRRSHGPFIPVNCGAIPENLIESQLFGHEKGAFTDAKAAKPGFFESADTGTLFLDEVGELSLGAQVRLLRALEQKEVTRVGSTKPIKVDVRVLAATHRDLEQMVKQEKFRQDLFFRLNGFTIKLPPLRDRPADIPSLIQIAATSFCARNGLTPPELGPTAVKQARSYAWPGNVRELLHVVERTLITRGPARIDELDLPTGGTPAQASAGGWEIDGSMPMSETLDPLMEELEKRYLMAALKRHEGHLGRTADHAGIHRKSLYNKLKRYGISVSDVKDDEVA